MTAIFREAPPKIESPMPGDSMETLVQSWNRLSERLSQEERWVIVDIGRDAKENSSSPQARALGAVMAAVATDQANQRQYQRGAHRRIISQIAYAIGNLRYLSPSIGKFLLENSLLTQEQLETYGEGADNTKARVTLVRRIASKSKDNSTYAQACYTLSFLCGMNSPGKGASKGQSPVFWAAEALSVFDYLSQPQQKWLTDRFLPANIDPMELGELQKKADLARGILRHAREKEGIYRVSSFLAKAYTQLGQSEYAEKMRRLCATYGPSSPNR